MAVAIRIKEVVLLVRGRYSVVVVAALYVLCMLFHAGTQRSGESKSMWLALGMPEPIRFGSWKASWQGGVDRMRSCMLTSKRVLSWAGEIG